MSIKIKKIISKMLCLRKNLHLPDPGFAWLRSSSAALEDLHHDLSVQIFIEKLESIPAK